MNLYLFLIAIPFYLSLLAPQKYINNKNKITLILLGGLILRLSVGVDNYLHDWDERYHALVSKNLMDQPLLPLLYKDALLYYDMSDFTNNHVWLSKPPLALWLASISMHLFGVNEIAFRMPSMLLSAFSMLITYKAAKILFNDKVALLAAFFYSVNGMIIELAGGRISSDVVETTFIFFVGLSMLYLIRAFNGEKRTGTYAFLCGIFTGLAFLSKWHPAMLTLIIFFIILFVARQDKMQKLSAVCMLMSGFLVTAVPWCLYCFLAFPEESAAMFSAVMLPLTHTIQGHDGSVFYYLDQIRIMFGELIYLPLLWFIYKFYKKADKNSLILILWFAIPLLVFSLSQTKRSNYILISAPAYFIITACFYYYMKNMNLTGIRKYLKLVVLILILLLPVRYAVERIKPFKEINIDDAWKVALVKWDERNAGKKVLFGYSDPIEAMFYTSAIVYSVIPDVDTLINIQNRGYDIFLNNHNNNLEVNNYISRGMKIISVPPKKR